MAAEQMLTVKAAAARLGAGVLVVYRRIWSGEIEAVDISQPGAKRMAYRVPESALDRYISAHRINIPGATR